VFQVLDILSDLHMAYIIESTSFTDEYEPMEEGLLPVTEKRTVSSLRIKLRLGNTGDLDKEAGYMAPQEVDRATSELFMRKLDDYNHRREGRWW
jgi:hypothetical protein